jgi:hypothetical protein
MLRVSPHDDPRKTRGQDGSLLLSCKTLSFSTSCRFIPALIASPFVLLDFHAKTDLTRWLKSHSK